MAVHAFSTINMKATGENIRRKRKERHYTVPNLCECFGFEALQTIYKWESGSGLPSIENLLTLSRLFETPVERILVYDTHVYDEEGNEVCR